MVIIGVNLPSNAYGKSLSDGGLCVANGGRVLFAAAEERFSRRKRQGGYEAAFEAAKQAVGFGASDIGAVVYSTCCGPSPRLSALPGLPGVPCVPFNHHSAHALGVYYTSPFDEALILVLDSGGNTLSASSPEWWSVAREQHSYYLASGAQINLLHRDCCEPFDAGVGEVYRAFTYYLGWASSRHAGKVMALAAHGSPERFNDEPIFFLDESGFIKSRVRNDPANPVGMVQQLLDDALVKDGAPRARDEAISGFHADLASWIQRETERIVCAKVSKLITTTGVHNICLAGGVAYNCLLPLRLRETTAAKEVFVHPASGDHGQCLGNAIYGTLLKGGGWSRDTFFSPYLGPEYQVTRTILTDALGSQAGVRFRQVANPSGEAAQLLAQGNVVAWFQGRSEYGPRALGNRSILGPPNDRAVVDLINTIKSREHFNPVAPAVLKERAPAFFKGISESPYMTETFRVEPVAYDRIPAGVHKDGTARVQTVASDTNNEFYKLISKFGETTGVPVVLNTSFNGAGEPTVETIRDAVNAFCRLDLRYAFIGSWILEKEGGLIAFPCTGGWELARVIEDPYTFDLNSLEKDIRVRWPGCPLHPRNRLGLHRSFTAWLRTGRKTTTIRWVANGVDLPEAAIMDVFETESYVHAEPCRAVFRVCVVALGIKRFSSLNGSDARRDGFLTLHDLRATLRAIYPDIKDDDLVTIYSLRILQ